MSLCLAFSVAGPLVWNSLSVYTREGGMPRQGHVRTSEDVFVCMLLTDAYCTMEVFFYDNALYKLTSALIVMPNDECWCSQGKFFQCHTGNANSVIHYFHEGCQVFENNKNYCPHCHTETDLQEIYVQPTEPHPLPAVQLDLNYFKSLGYDL